MNLLKMVKDCLRVTHDALDSEIEMLIESCKIDLMVGGLKQFDESNKLACFVVCLYCKANFGYDNADSDRLQKSYMLAKQRLIHGEMGGIYGTV